MSIRHIVLNCPIVDTEVACGYHRQGYLPGACTAQSFDGAEPGSLTFVDNGQKYLAAYRITRTDVWSEATQFIAPVGVVLDFVAAKQLACACGGDEITPITLARIGQGDTWKQVCSHPAFDVE